MFNSGWIEFEKTTFNTNEVWESGSRYTRTRTRTHTRTVCSERRKAREVANGSLGCARAFFFSLRSLLIFIPARVLRAISILKRPSRPWRPWERLLARAASIHRQSGTCKWRCSGLVCDRVCNTPTRHAVQGRHRHRHGAGAIVKVDNALAIAMVHAVAAATLSTHMA
jgi:hypothetical protein